MSERIPRQDPTALEHLSHIELPASTQPGGFDHAAVHRGMARLYVAHTANDAVDVIDCAGDRYLRSLGGLAGVAGVLVAEEQNLFFTSNRGENSVSIFSVLTHGNWRGSRSASARTASPTTPAATACWP